MGINGSQWDTMDPMELTRFTRPPPEDRFWSKVNKTADCWLWTGKQNDHGYGIFTISSQQYRAHRVVWEVINGPIPGGKLVRHMCDQRMCVNPAHLVLGTAQDNAADAARRSRINRKRGSGTASAKLAEDQVAWARHEWRSGRMTKAALARRFSVSNTTMDQALRRVTWKHVA